MNQFNQSMTRSQESILATNKVLKNTYILLSMTLLFSAATAGTAMVMNLPFFNPIISIIGMFGLLFLTSYLKNSVWGIVSVFAFTGFMGLTLGPLLNAYLTMYSNGHQLIMTSLGGTGVIFLGLSAYVLTTKKDFSFLGGFLMVGMLVAVLAIVGLMFFPIPAAQLALSAVIIMLMSGFILFDTSRIINGGQTNYIMATISLYLNIYNIFVHLLHILSAMSGRD